MTGALWVSFFTLILSVNKSYTDAILIRSKGVEKRAHPLFIFSIWVLIGYVSLALLAASVMLMYHFDFGLTFLVVVFICYFASIATVVGTMLWWKIKFEMVPLVDKLSIKILGGWFEDDKAVILGRGATTLLQISSTLYVITEYVVSNNILNLEKYLPNQ